MTRAELAKRLRHERELLAVNTESDGAVVVPPSARASLAMALEDAATYLEGDGTQQAMLAARGASAEGPVIQFDYDHARHFVTVAMRELALRPEKDLEEAIAAYCTEEDLRAQIAKCVVDVIAQITRQEVERYYRDGAGREIVVEAVMAVLRQRDKS